MIRIVISGAIVLAAALGAFIALRLVAMRVGTMD